MEDCIFCKIIRKEIPAEIIYEDEQTFAALDINPHSYGHTLVIPKEHAPTVLEISPESLAAVALTIQKVAGILHASLNSDGFTIGLNQGEVAGQTVFHLHTHILPRFKGDGGREVQSAVNQPSKESIAETAAKIKRHKFN